MKTVQKIVDEIGWNGLRSQYPELWKKILKSRIEDKKYIDLRDCDC